MPSGLSGPGEDPEAPLAAAGSEVRWLQPIPDALVTPASDDPAAIVASRESFRLALIASLPYLTAWQRAVLLLRDVLSWPAAEVAELLGTTTAAVKSTLLLTLAMRRGEIVCLLALECRPATGETK